MKLSQEKLKFNPITLELTTEEEAVAFLNIIDFLDEEQFPRDSKERELIIKISNAFSNEEVVVPNFNEINNS